MRPKLNLFSTPRDCDLVLRGVDVATSNTYRFQPGVPIERAVHNACGYTQPNAGTRLMVMPPIETQADEVVWGLTQTSFQSTEVTRTAPGL